MRNFFSRDRSLNRLSTEAHSSLPSLSVSKSPTLTPPDTSPRQPQQEKQLLDIAYKPNTRHGSDTDKNLISVEANIQSINTSEPGSRVSSGTSRSRSCSPWERNSSGEASHSGNSASSAATVLTSNGYSEVDEATHSKLEKSPSTGSYQSISNEVVFYKNSKDLK